MKYALLIYAAESAYPEPNSPEMQQLFEDYAGFTTEINEKGGNLPAEALQPVATATTVRVRNGETLVTDGPFAETKEQLGGFYLVEAANLDEAIAWAAKIPDAVRGSIEVRPVMEFS